MRAAAPAAMVAVLNGLWPGRGRRLRRARDPAGARLARRDRRVARRGAAPGAGAAGAPACRYRHGAARPAGRRAGALARRSGAAGRGYESGYVMTHLVAAEAPDDPRTPPRRAASPPPVRRLPAAPRSFANSSGMFLGPGFGSDLARPGAALCGINPTPGRPNPMQGVVRLSAPHPATSRDPGRCRRRLQRRLARGAAEPHRDGRRRLRRWLPARALQRRRRPFLTVPRRRW